MLRYHSLIVDAASCPGQLEAIAWTCGEHHAVQLQQQGQAQPSSAAGAMDVHETQEAASAGHGEKSSTSSIEPLLVGTTNGSSSGCMNAGSQRGQRGVDTARRGPPSSHDNSNGVGGSSRGLIMGLAHKQRPHYGVQFHPESIATSYGIQVLINFRDLAYQHCNQQVPEALQGMAGVGPPGRGCAPRSWPTAVSKGVGSKGLQAGTLLGKQQPGHLSQQGKLAVVCSGGKHQQQQQVCGSEGSDADDREQPQQQQLLEQGHEQQQEHQLDKLQLSAATAAAGAAVTARVTLSEALASAVPATATAAAAAAGPAAAAAPAAGVSALCVSWRHLPGVLEAVGGSQVLFEQLVGPQEEDSFWLDR